MAFLEEENNLYFTDINENILRKMVSTRGFEPPTPGFIPLRLSPPPISIG